MSDTDSKWNTPLIPARSATYVVHAATSISAPAAVVFRTIRNTDTWKDWHGFIPKVTIKTQPPEDDTTDAEFADLVLLETSRALSRDSDIEASLPPQTMSRRLSQASGKSDSNNPASAQQFEEINQGRRGSYASQKSNKENKANKLPAIPAVEEDVSGANGAKSSRDATSTSSTSGGMLAPPASPFTSNSPSRRGSLAPAPATGRASGSAKRRLSINSIYGELSIRLIVGTQLVLHIRPKLPTSPTVFKQLNIIVTEVSRPPDPLNPDENLINTAAGTTALVPSKTHTGDKGSGIYRIVWGSDSSKPKFLIQFQRVWEIRPRFSDDGKEEWSDVTMWECARGMTVKSTMGEKSYLQKLFVATLEGLKQFCESLGGKGVERRDFSVS